MPSVIAKVAASQPTAVTRTFTFPAGTVVQANDLVLMCTSADANAGCTFPTGWFNPLGTGNTPVRASSESLAVGAHWVTTTEATNNTLTYTMTSFWSTTQAGGTVGILVRGVSTSDPIDWSASGFSLTSVTPHILPTLTGTNLGDGSLVLGVIVPDLATTYPTDPGGWTRQAGVVTGSNGRNTTVWTRDTPTTANTDVAATNATPSAADQYCAINLALKPTTLPSFGKGFTFLMFVLGRHTVRATQLYDAGLQFPFQAADEPTGAVIDVTQAPYNVPLNNSAVDSRPLINSAIAACPPGGIVYLPNGTYYFKGSANGLLIGAAKAGVTLRGQSLGGVIIKTMFSASTNMVIFVQDGATNCIIENLTVDYQSGSNYDEVIRIGTPDETTIGRSPANTRITVRNCHFQSFNRVGIGLNNTKWGLIDNVTIPSALQHDGLGQGYGVCLDGPATNNNWVRNCTIGGSTTLPIRHAIVIVDMANHNLLGGTLDGLPGATRHPGYTPAANECGNHISYCVSGQIDFHGEKEYSNECSYNVCHDAILNSTTVSPNGGGIEVGEPYTDEVLGGTGHGPSGYYNSIHHNEVYNCPEGMRIMDKSHYTYVEDNYFHNCDKGVAAYETSGYPTPGILGFVVRRNYLDSNIDNLHLEDFVVGATVEDNTIVNATAFGIWTDSTVTNYRMVRNTLSGNATPVSLGSSQGVYA